ncbi:MAG: S8 family serine peptidase [Lachnospiraceae bacterium]
MLIIKKKYLICYIGLFLLLTVCGGSESKHTTVFPDAADIHELVLLWNAPLSEENALLHLAEYYPELSLSEHDGDYSLCEYDASVENAANMEQLLALLNTDPALLLAEPNYTMELMELSYPDDPYFDAQWAFSNTGTYSHYYGSLSIPQPSLEGIDMNILQAWEAYPLSKENTRPVIVAVIDTGVDYRHPDLAEHMWINTNEIPDNGIDDDGNGYIDDIYGWDFFHDDSSVCHYAETADGYTVLPEDNDNHGTHCAGIIAAAANNGIGIAGVASNVDVRIMSLKIHGGSASSGSIANAIKAIRYAEAMGASICNMSWGTTNYSQALELVIQESSMLFVTAAGNEASNNNSTPVYPASFRLPNVISVAFIDAFGNLASSSNYGTSTVDIAAPGQDIYSTLVGTYGYSSGSSMAAPHVTGLAAMIYAYRDEIYPSQVKDLIINTMKPLSSLDAYLIHPGIPDALAAIRALDNLVFDTQAPSISLETTYERDMIVLRVSAFDAGGSGIRRVKYSYGSKSLDFFRTEGGGTVLSGDRAVLAKSGFYTFFLEDYAENYTLYNYYVEDDTKSPEVTVSYTVTSDYGSFVVSVSAVDDKSGVKALKYLPGEHSSEAFLADGIELPVSPANAVLEFSTATTDALSFYALDYRGNSTVTTIYPEVVPATSLHLNVLERSLSVDGTFRLQALAFPLDTTDSITFVSLNPELLSIDESGLITAHLPGETFIIASTTSSIQSVCKIVIHEPELALIQEDVSYEASPEETQTPPVESMPSDAEEPPVG